MSFGIDTQNSVKTKPELFLIRFVKSLLWFPHIFFIKKFCQSPVIWTQFRALILQFLFWVLHDSCWIARDRQMCNNRILSRIKKYCLHELYIQASSESWHTWWWVRPCHLQHLSFFLVLKGRDLPVGSDEFRIARMFYQNHVINIFLSWNVQCPGSILIYIFIIHVRIVVQP